MSKPNSKEFYILIGNILFAYKQFCLAKEISLSYKKDIFRRNVLFWDTIRISFTRGYLGELAKTFEVGRDKNVLSIYYILDFQFQDYHQTIDKLRKVRNKFLMHNDIETLNDLDKFLKNLSLKPIDDIEPLFFKIIEVLDRVKQNFDPDSRRSTVDVFKEVSEGAKGDIANIIKRVELGSKQF